MWEQEGVLVYLHVNGKIWQLQVVKSTISVAVLKIYEEIENLPVH